MDRRRRIPRGSAERCAGGVTTELKGIRWTTAIGKCAVRQDYKFERASELGQDGFSGERPPVTERPFVNRRTGQVIQVPDGIDPGWGHNPGLSRAMTVVRRVAEQLATAGEAQARDAIAEIWQTPLPAIVSKLPAVERVQLPVAVSPVLAKALDAKTAVVAVSRDTLAEKTGEHRDRPTDLKTFEEAQALIDTGTIVNRGERNRRNIVAERDGNWWNVAVARSGAGFLRLVSVHRVRAEQVVKWLKREKNADGRP